MARMHGRPTADVPAESPLARAPNRLGSVVLAVRDLDAVGRFYQDALGLAVLGRDGQGLHLGAGGRVLLMLRPGATAFAPPSATGLYHIAFLVAARADLAAWLVHAARNRIAIDGASDHRVSEAVYLTDPEGNGVEIYADRPADAWLRPGGFPEMGTEPLDLAGLARSAAGPWSGMPDGCCVGHVHLRVGGVEPADAFYAGLLGFDRNPFAPTVSFNGTGGYHHQIAANCWRSRGAGPRRPGTTGLVEFQLVHRDAASFAVLRGRVAASRATVRTEGEDLVVADPSGVDVRLSPGPEGAR